MKISSPITTRLFKRKEKKFIDFDEAEKNCQEFLRDWEAAYLMDPSLRKNFLDINRVTMVNWQTIRRQKIEQLRESLQTKVQNAIDRKIIIEDEYRFRVKL
jgi:hypothetical protein